MAQHIQELREKINLFTTGNAPGYERVAVQLFGNIGHGKSSLINSCVCVVKDEEYQNLSGAGTLQGGMTEARKVYELTNALVMVDNRGFITLKREEILEACAQLRSLREIGEVNWDKDNLQETLTKLPSKYKNRPADFIVSVLVYSATQIFGNDEIDAVQKLITNSFRITGIHPIVVITNCTADKTEQIKKMFGDFGVMKRICLENYTENNYDRTEEKDKKILEFVNMCIEEAQRGLRMRREEDHQMRFVTQATKQIQLESKGEEIKREEKAIAPAIAPAIVPAPLFGFPQPKGGFNFGNIIA